jgi:hypothetical protein
MSQPEYEDRYPTQERDANDRRLTVVEAPPPDPVVRYRFEYLSGKVAGRRLDAMLNEYGRDGWQLRVCVSNTNAVGDPDGTFFVMLERRVSLTAVDISAT